MISINDRSSLGAKLAVNIARIEQEKLDKAAAIEAKKIADNNRRRNNIIIDFDFLKDRIASFINAGGIVTPLRLTHSIVNENWRVPISSVLHQDYDLWLQFAKWCCQEDLKAACIKEYDSTGTKYWWSISIAVETNDG